MQKPTPQIVVEQSEEFLLEAALNALAKALKAMTFYPQEHPLRDESITSALARLRPFLQEKELVLLWSRDGCAVVEGALKSTSQTARMLASEMLVRKVQRLIIFPEISAKDIKAFLALMTIDATDIYSRGGIEHALFRAGVKTIGVNEFDLSVLGNQQNPGEGSATAAVDAAIAGGSSAAMQKPESSEERTLDALLAQLVKEQDEHSSLQLMRDIIDVAEKIKRSWTFEPLMAALAVLLQEHSAAGRSGAEREFIRYALEQIADGSMTAFIMDQIEHRSEEHAEMLDTLCSTIAKTLVYPLIQRLCVAESLPSRKAFAQALTRTGEAGIPALVSMLKDERWYVVRNMVTILGEIHSADSVKALQMTSRHPEAKVRKEVIKSLVKIAPQAGENTLVALLDDIDKDVVRQVIFSFGVMRSRAAVRPLLDIVTGADAFLKGLELKKQAVASLGKIGDRQATAPLMDILQAKGWFAPRRWSELKIAAATALGQLGDESALPLLKRFAKRDSPLGEACSDAADNLERVVK